jgi:hypothetical protein
MSWTQGVLPREEMSERQIERLEKAYKLRTGETDSIEYITWFAIDGSDAIAHFRGGRGFKIGEHRSKDDD